MVTNRSLHRGKLLKWRAQIPVGCVVEVGGRSSAHHWCRKLQALGLDAWIISAQLVPSYRMQGKTGNNDANDAAAICEAASRPQMYFIPPKTTGRRECWTYIACAKA